MNIVKRIIFYTLIIFLFSCKSDETKTYNVDDTLNNYLQSFLLEGSNRGKIFDVTSEGLILKFGKLDDNVAGITYYTNPVRIIIDSTYWNAVKNYDNAEDLRKDVVYHELGHGLLKREHLNSYLNNSEWKSIMCGGTEIDNRSWNINFRSIRTDYYLNELFDISTATPSWTSKSMEATDGLTNLIIDYDISSGNSFESYWSDGILTYQNSSSNGNVVNFSSISNNNDFYLECKFKITNVNTTTPYGIIFGKESTNIDFYHYLFINNNKHVFIGNTKSYGWYVDILNSTINTDDYNILGIRRNGYYLYYYINGNCIYYDKITSDYPGYLYGIDVPSNTTLKMDYLKIYSSSSNTTKKATNKKHIMKEITITPNKWKMK